MLLMGYLKSTMRSDLSDPRNERTRKAKNRDPAARKTIDRSIKD